MNSQQQISSQQIISAVQTMPLNELEQLVGNVLAARAERVAPHLSGEESKLLRTIQQTLPDDSRLRMKELQTLRDSGELSAQGFTELAELIEELEMFHAERMKAMASLADLRGVTLQTAIRQVGLRLPDYE